MTGNSTVPGPIFSDTGTSTFFRDQIFPVPVPSKKEQNSRDRDVTLWQALNVSFPKRRWEGKCVPPPLEGLSLWGHQWFGWWGRGPEQYNRRAAVSYNGQEGSLTMGRTYAITPPSSLEVPTWVVTSSHMVGPHTDSSHIGLFLQFWSCMSFAILIEPFSFLDGSILKKIF